MIATLLAVGWEPELRGILTVILGAVVWMGSVYLILGTNLGARLGFLVAFTGLHGFEIVREHAGATTRVYASRSTALRSPQQLRVARASEDGRSRSRPVPPRARTV